MSLIQAKYSVLNVSYHEPCSIITYWFYFICLCARFVTITTGLWWMNQEFFPVGIISPWFAVLIYHVLDEQQACRWLKIRHTVSRHQHYHRHNEQMKLLAWLQVFSDQMLPTALKLSVLIFLNVLFPTFLSFRITTCNFPSVWWQRMRPCLKRA
jgi:hypothetical protein